MKTICSVFIFTVAVLFNAGFAAAQCCATDTESVKKDNVTLQYIDKENLQGLIKENKDLVIIDVLSPKSYAENHIKGAVNIPYNKISEEKVLEQLDKNKTYVLYCANKRCKASTGAAKILLKHGFRKVYDYENGLAEWMESELAVSKAAELCGHCGAVKGSPACCK